MGRLQNLNTSWMLTPAHFIISMGLFNLFKSDKPSYSDKVWMTKDAALKGMITETLQILKKSEVPVVLSFFSDRQQEVIDFTSVKGVPYSVIDSNSAVQRDNLVLLMDAQWLRTSQHAMDFLVQQFNVSAVHLLFYGHYPIPEKENELLNKVAVALNPKNELKFFSSLDDRAFEMFGAGNIKSIMEKMGLKQDEAVEHAMVTKAMARAREKIAEGVAQEIAAPTEAVWYQKNYSK